MTLFTKALQNNIERTFSYSHAKNKYNYRGKAENYDPLPFFINLLTTNNPFQLLMELENVAFKRAKETIIRHQIPYTLAQEKQALVYVEVTQEMNKQRNDVVAMYQEDLRGTGVVVFKEPFHLTTIETIEMHEKINKLPKSQRTQNILHEHKLPTLLRTSIEQKEAVKNCLHSQISVLIGGAGVGKSFVTAAIIEQLKLNNRKVVVLAPTHKAKEALQEKVGASPIVQTIHSFVHNPQKCDAIVIDESGMLSTPLLLMLLKRHTTEQLVFVGDKNQLPPIEYGRPFERIQKLFKVSELKENKRSESSDIIALGREILGFKQNANRRMPNIIQVNTIEEAYEQGADVVLSFMNSTVSQVNENRRIKNGQPTLSPFFSVGDKIMAKTNEPSRFYNGQLFTITHRNRAKNEKTGKPIVLTSQKDLERNFTLSYGLTVHKSQGSEWDTVAYKPSIYDTQNIAYVAVSRAKKKLIIIGNEIKTNYPADRTWVQLV